MGHLRFDWAAISADPTFRTMQRRKRQFATRWLGFVLVYFLLLPLGAGFLPGWLAYPLIGEINVGLVLALSQFAVAALAATRYVRTAGRDFDRVNEAVIHEAFTRYRIR